MAKKDDGKRSGAERKTRWTALVGALAGVAIITASLGCLYLVMRTVGLENEGSCVSGGPYQVSPGHECEDRVFALGYGGAIGVLVGFALFLWGAHRYGGPLVVTSMAGFSWIAFFCGLGGSFLSISAETPGPSDVASEFSTVGIIFTVMGSLGLAVALGPIPYSVRTRSLDYPKPTLREWGAWLVTVAVGVVFGIVGFQLGNGILY